MSSLEAYLTHARNVVLDALRASIPKDTRHTGRLYERAIDYPLREAKGLRPALAIAACRALGGELDAVRGLALSLELFHNAFLVHDDIEDGSELRRHRSTLHREVGMAVAVNVGDGMLALALQPLLDGLPVLGVARSLSLLEAVNRMARESAEGQAMELEWIREGTWAISPKDYLRMVNKKTAWYSFITPVVGGARCAGRVPTPTLHALGHFAQCLGLAFQVQDDVLNVTASASAMGKETAGDLWEGKRTLLLLHALRVATPEDRDTALRILARARPDPAALRRAAVLDELVADGLLTPQGRERLEGLEGASGAGFRTEADVRWLLAWLDRTGSVDAARAVARRYAQRARTILLAQGGRLPASQHRRFLEDVVDFVVQRSR